MGLLSLEHSVLAYRADFVLTGAAVAGLATALLAGAPPAHAAALAATAGLGLVGWTAAEYGLHRCVLHGLRPFSRWHAEHHARPQALICTPTALTAALFATLVFAPAWGLAGLWPACALTLGALAGYLAYALTHHATHHWHGRSAWLRRRRRWHALHHHGGPRACYGVTSGFWDAVFDSGPRRKP